MNKKREKYMKVIFFLSALTSILAVSLICIFMLSKGLPAIKEIGLTNFLLGKEWSPSDHPAQFGILPMISGSICVTLGAVLFGVPTGIFTAVFLSKICSPKIYKILKPSVDLLAGIPSVIYGFFGITVLVPLTRNLFGGNGNSILTASILLGIMILPTIINISEAALKAVPEIYYEGALALGASHIRAIFFVLIPAAKEGILASVILGIGRAAGETMAVVMVAGNQARMPNGIFKGVRTLTANIVLEMGYAADLHRDALIATGVVLFLFILIINLGFSFIKRRVQVERKSFNLRIWAYSHFGKNPNRER